MRFPCQASRGDVVVVLGCQELHGTVSTRFAATIMFNVRVCLRIFFPCLRKLRTQPAQFNTHVFYVSCGLCAAVFTHLTQIRKSQNVSLHLPATTTSTFPPLRLQPRPMAVFSMVFRCTWSGGDNRLARSVPRQRRRQECRWGTRPPPLGI